MNNCSQCGSSIPDGQRVCSMCYGDISYGNDGYYQQWAEEQLRKQERDLEELFSDDVDPNQRED